MNKSDLRTRSQNSFVGDLTVVRFRVLDGIKHFEKVTVMKPFEHGSFKEISREKDGRGAEVRNRGREVCFA